MNIFGFVGHTVSMATTHCAVVMLKHRQSDNAEMNERGHIPAHLWALKFEFQIFACRGILYFCMVFPQLFNNIKAT